LYDEIFFDNYFKNNYKGKLSFSLSKRMTKSAGKTICPKNIEAINQRDLNIEIRISIDFLIQYDAVQYNKRVCGIKTNNSLDALQLVFEHELCHVIEFISFHNSNCNKERFKSIARNLFGHVQSYHELPTYKQIARQNYGFNIGDTVTFEFKDRKLEGVLYRINKRATIMVKDTKGSYMDKYKNRYTKYYVPLECLKKE
jgi:predicted SprT family Zn-dependent metalloprotease